MLNRLYEKFDSISDELGVFKVIMFYFYSFVTILHGKNIDIYESDLFRLVFLPYFCVCARLLRGESTCD